MTIRVLIADDQAMIRDGLAALLASAPDIDVVGQAGDGREAVDLTRTLDPDVVVMDIRMPGMDGLAATAEILGGQPADAPGGCSRTRQPPTCSPRYGWWPPAMPCSRPRSPGG